MTHFRRSILAIMLLMASAHSQSILFGPSELEKIALLKSDRRDVAEAFSASTVSTWGVGSVEYFHFDDWNVTVFYSTGGCSAGDDWDVPAGTVTHLWVKPKNRIMLRDMKFDRSMFRKEKLDRINGGGAYVLYDKPAGNAFEIWGERVIMLHRVPSTQNYPNLCSGDEVKEYYSSKRWRRPRKMPKHFVIDYNLPADVTDLRLSRSQLAAPCDSTVNLEKQVCPGEIGRIGVSTVAADPENDVLTYFYRVSGGKIVGTGPNVVWDLSGVKPGTYTILAAADDGCGLCGKLARRSVVVN